MGRKEFRELADPSTVRETLAALPIDPGSETVALEAARGRVLAERIDADRDVPGFDRASMDGYAVRARDTFGADEADPARLELVGTIHAGEAPAVEPAAGEAVEISTGAVLPDGADAVVPVERTDSGGDEVAVRTAIAPGEHVMYAGADVAAGERILGPGRRLTAREIGLLAALGRETVPVRGRPTVGIISTGDELVRPGDSLADERGQIYDVNSYSMVAAIDDAGGEPRLYEHAGDDRTALAATLREAAGACDLVLSSGSTSASAVDVLYEVIEDEGELHLHGAAIKPGKPLLVGELEAAPYVGLPGYPVSAMLVFREFVAPVLRAAAGLDEPTRATTSGVLADTERFAEGRLRLLPVGLVTDGAGETLVTGVDKGSGATTSLVAADGLVTVPPSVDHLAAGETVEVTLFSPDVEPPPVLGVGEDDPVVARALDAVPGARYLPIGARPARRKLASGVPDIAVVTAETVEGASVAASWHHQWGLVVPPGNPADVAGVAELVDRDLRLANRTGDSWLRTALDTRLEELATDRDSERRTLETAIDGFGWTLRGHESPVRAVERGAADVGLGLAETATRRDCGFVELGTETVRLFVGDDRADKPGVETLIAAID